MRGGAAMPAGRLRSLPRLPRIGPGVRALAASRRLRRRLLMLAAALLLLAGGYQVWLRDSSLVAVDRVTVTGLSTSDAERVRVALSAAGRSMTTLHVDQEALERAVAGFPVVRDLEVTTDFPHGLRIDVIEHVPAAIAVGDGGRVAVAGDGTARASAAIAGAAPAALRRRIEGVGEDGDLGQVAQLRDGPELIFGDATRVRAKWAAAARVLADLEASGASYIDVRVAGRPAVGGLPAETITPVAPAGTTPTIPPATATGAVAATTTDPNISGTTVPPADGTVPPAGTPPTPGTITETGTTPPAEPTTPASAAPAPQPTAPVSGGAAGGATAAPSP